MALRVGPATPSHLPGLRTLIFEHGANAWNWLPTDGIDAHLCDIATGQAHALLALQGTQLQGAVTWCHTHDFARYQAPARQHALHGYICEAVVRRDAAGQGLGTRLLQQVVALLQAQGLQEIYIDRHEENAASAGMMRRAGFEEIDTFAEPARRPHGSGRTTVCRWLLSPG